jgi:hypothetical protein
LKITLKVYPRFPTIKFKVAQTAAVPKMPVKVLNKLLAPGIESRGLPDTRHRGGIAGEEGSRERSNGREI